MHGSTQTPEEEDDRVQVIQRSEQDLLALKAKWSALQALAQRLLLQHAPLPPMPVKH